MRMETVVIIVLLLGTIAAVVWQLALTMPSP